MKSIKDRTLCFLVKRSKNKISRILLGRKKKDFGKNLWVGVGGKVGDNIKESIEEATIREAHEEINIKVKSILKVAEITFLFTNKESWNQKVHVFISESWEGQPSESDEIIPKWFKRSEIPYDHMWEDAKYWLPQILDDKKLKSTITYNNQIKIINKKTKEIKGF